MVKLPSIEERLEEEKKLRLARKGRMLSFGVTYLDRAIDGIAPNDLVVIGAPTGSGKTELVTHIAGTNAFNKKRILFFSLEAEESEIESRLKFKIATKLYFNDKRPERPFVPNACYRNWYWNKLNKNFRYYEEKAVEYLSNYFRTFRTIYRTGNEFKVGDFQRQLMAYKDYTDLVILDHLNYFDHDDPNENRAVSEIVKKIRDLALISGLPIILVAHIKKVDKRSKVLVPEIDDFHGTSNISKIATKAILMAPDRDEPTNPKRFTTYFRIGKYRVDGSATRYIGRCYFDIEKNRYDNDFEIGYLSSDGSSFIEIDDPSMVPYWAKDPGGRIE